MTTTDRAVRAARQPMMTTDCAADFAAHRAARDLGWQVTAP